MNVVGHGSGRCCKGWNEARIRSQKAAGYSHSDIIMPHLDGLGIEKLDRWAEKRPTFIIPSAVGQDKITQRPALGAEYYIVKPFDMEILALRIRQLKDSGHTSVLGISYTMETKIPYCVPVQRNLR